MSTVIGSINNFSKGQALRNEKACIVFGVFNILDSDGGDRFAGL